MVQIRVTRTSTSQSDFSSFTTRSDFIRGTGADDFLSIRPLTASEQTTFDSLIAQGIAAVVAYQAIYAASGELDDFGGNDRIFGRGGDDVIIDLLGSNLILTEEGDDEIYLGEGDDRIYDDGGNNIIQDLGGNNLITTGDEDDSILTGAGDDNINAFDGRNIINAGQGDNLVRGGNGYDEIVVGTGDDFVEVRGGFAGEDTNGNGVLDPGEDRDFDGVLDLPDTELFGFLNLNIGFEAQNYVVDIGGDDTIRSTASSGDQGDDVVLSDVIVTTDDTASSPPFRLIGFNPGVFGNDLIEMGAGDNLIVDGGGNNIVRTLAGSDIVFTSFFQAGSDNIDTGAGTDTINPGGGMDTVRSGVDSDNIDLEFDGQRDTLVYADADVNPNSFDTIFGFDGGGVDVFDLRDLDAGFGNLLTATVTGGLLIAIDGNGNGGFDPNADDIVAVVASASAPLTADNFLFDAMA